MSLTRKEKNQIIKTLKKARPFVAEGSSSVCGAVRLTNSIPADICLTRGYVSGLISPRFFVTGWLRIEHGIHLNADQEIEYRLAWIDHMLKELEK